MSCSDRNSSIILKGMYPSLRVDFFNLTSRAMVSSLWRARLTKPERIEDFRKGVKAGNICFIVSHCSASDLEKLRDMGLSDILYDF